MQGCAKKWHSLKISLKAMISNPESLVDGYLSRWLLDAYSTANTLLQNTPLKDHKILKKRIKTEGVSLVHDTPSVFILRYTKPITFSRFPHLPVLASFLMEYASPSSPCQNRLPFPDISWRDYASLPDLHADYRVPAACLA